MTNRMASRPRFSLARATVWWMAVAFLIATTSLLNVAVIRKENGKRVIESTKVLPAHQRAGTLRRGLMEASPASALEKKEYARTLVGIFSRDDAAGSKQRQHYRSVLEGRSKKDVRICNVAQFRERQDSLQPKDCLLVYTFVVGAHAKDEDEFPPEIPNLRFGEQETDVVVNQIASPMFNDVNLPDVTRLNIRENENEGKSQTFLYYAFRDIMSGGREIGDPQIEYCMKVSHNTFFSVDGFLKFSREELLPAPFHRGVLAGVLRDKGYGMSSDDGHVSKVKKPFEPLDSESPRLESFWGNQFEGVHLYTSGQLYILSIDLIEFIISEVPFSRERIAPGGYVMGREGHDISSMAFHSPTPIQLITINNSQRFWTSPVKKDASWEQLVAGELSAAL